MKLNMKIILIVVILFFMQLSYADTDGKICIKENEVTIEAKDIYLKSSDATKHIVNFKNGNVKYLKSKTVKAEKCKKIILLPFAKTEIIVLKKTPKHIVSLIINSNSQKLKDKYGVIWFHHFSARVVQNEVSSGELVTSLALGEGTKVETVD